MTLLDKRLQYGPFEYPQAYEYTIKQQKAHWLVSEISMASDISDWKSVLTETEKNIVGSVLKGFTMLEVIIQDYWSNKIGRWFKIPELQMLASTISSMECIHAIAYSHLNESLGIVDYEAFLHEPTAKAKIDRLVDVKGSDKSNMAKSIAIFSAFNEGVSLFSSFAILLNFSRFNKLKGVGQVVTFSIKDESLHSEAGCWIFRTLIQEFPEIMTDDFKKDIYDAARFTVQLEDDFIDQCYALGESEGLSKDDLKNYIRYRANTKLQDLGLKMNWKNINKESIDKMMWFDILSSGQDMSDFFASRVTNYSKGNLNWDTMYDNEKAS